MKIHFKKIFFLFFGILLLFSGLTTSVWYYRAYVLPLREVFPIIKALQTKESGTAFYNANKRVYNLFVYPNASNDLFTGYAAQKVRQEFLNVLHTAEDVHVREFLLDAISGMTLVPEDSRIQFVAEDWIIIEEAVKRINKEKGYNHIRGQWSVYQYDGRKMLGHPIPAIP